MAEGMVRVEGLAQLRRALLRCDRRLTSGVREGLRDAAAIVAHETERRAPQHSGRMARSVRSFARATSAGVRVTAMKVSRKYPAGYPYPRRIEFEDGGVRAFARPALEAKREAVVRRLGYVLDDVREAWEVG